MKDEKRSETALHSLMFFIKNFSDTQKRMKPTAKVRNIANLSEKLPDGNPNISFIDDAIRHIKKRDENKAKTKSLPNREDFMIVAYHTQKSHKFWVWYMLKTDAVFRQAVMEHLVELPISHQILSLCLLCLILLCL